MLIWGQTGYSKFLPAFKTIKNNGNVGFGGGLGYRYVIKNHFYVGAGVEFLALNNNTKPFSSQSDSIYFDDEGDIYTMNYKIEKYRQIDKIYNLNIPVFIGFKTHTQEVDFYMQAGVKFGYMLKNSSLSKIDLFKTTGKYDIFPEPLEDIEGRFVTINDYKQDVTIALNRFQMAGFAEVGVEIPLDRKNNKIAIGIFCDYGFLNLQTEKLKNDVSKPIFEYNDHYFPSDLSVNNLLQTSENVSKKTNTFFVGAKVTFFLSMRKKPCPECFPKRRYY